MTQIIAPWLQNSASQTVCAMLSDAGFQAWFVGGCVRNALLGVPVTDFDITTDARPDTVMELAGKSGLRAIPTGIDHGTVTVISEGQPYEITTFRRDIETNGRHAVVAFSDSIEEDAKRRDFTMNALYAGADGTVSDPLGGLVDIETRHLRFIGDASARIREDYLRILRFFRFTAWYADPSHGIDADGLAACAELSDGIEGLSRERVGSEMIKLLSAPDPAPAAAAMAACGALMRVMPGAGAHLLTVLVHVEDAAGLAPDPIRRLAALGGEGVAEALRLSKDQARVLAVLHAEMGAETPAGELGYRQGADIALSVLALRASLSGREIEDEKIALALQGASETCPLTAADLMPGLMGPALGAALREAENRWIASGFTLDKDALLR